MGKTHDGPGAPATARETDTCNIGYNPQRDELFMLAREVDEQALSHMAARIRDRGHGRLISYSRKVFIPLTRLCRDVCHYCTYATAPRFLERAYMNPEEVLDVARKGKAAGCKEALFTLGDKPELRYPIAREALERLGYQSTLEYLASMARMVVDETGLFPHINAGVMEADEISMLKRVSASQGLMLECASDRLCQEGGPHFGSPDKQPRARLDTIRRAGELKVPFTSGLLIGIGETREERLDSLLRLRELHQEYGHIQEIIVQNFRAKADTPMANAPEPGLSDLQWTIAMARIVFGPSMSIQAPPNLSPGQASRLIAAGLNDWGGVSPVTRDHVNPEAPWPHLDALAADTEAAGKVLVERLSVYPRYIFDDSGWLSPQLRRKVIACVDSDGLARTDHWYAGAPEQPPLITSLGSVGARQHGLLHSDHVQRILARATEGRDLAEGEIVRLFQARGDDAEVVCRAADRLRADVCGDVVSYVVNRNINYSNICSFHCSFCAFSTGKLSEHLRGAPYDLELREIVRRAGEAVSRGATEVCMQGGIHPDYTGETYLEICRAVKQAWPDLHIHAFSPLEIWQGAQSLGLPVSVFLQQLKEAGLGTLPGTAAEILDDDVRTVICPDKLSTQQWLDVVESAHRSALPTTATIMFGHVDRPVHWARHLILIRALQERTGGFTEFVPLPFVHMEAPIFLNGTARKGPSFREVILMHAVARLALHPHITNIQTSWTKLGSSGAQACLSAGANDLGGTLMNESISRAAGARHGEEMPPERMESLIRALGRRPHQRTTLYEPAPDHRMRASFGAPPVSQPVAMLVRRGKRGFGHA